MIFIFSKWKKNTQIDLHIFIFNICFIKWWNITFDGFGFDDSLKLYTIYSIPKCFIFFALNGVHGLNSRCLAFVVMLIKFRWQHTISIERWRHNRTFMFYTLTSHFSSVHYYCWSDVFAYRERKSWGFFNLRIYTKFSTLLNNESEQEKWVQNIMCCWIRRISTSWRF